MRALGARLAATRTGTVAVAVAGRGAGASAGTVFLVALLAASPARGNALDTFGFGPRSEAMAGAQTADASGWAAAFHNPAAVARTDDVEAAIGYSGAVTHLNIDGTDAGITTPRGTSLGLAVPIPLGHGVKLAFGVAAYIPDQFIVRVQLIPIAEPHFVLLDNNLQHIVVQPVLALRILRWLSVGGGVTLLADAAGNGITFDVGAVGGQKVGQAALDVSLPIRAAPVVGVLVEPTPHLRLGATWRGEIDLKLKLDILSNVNVAGLVTGDVLISLRALDFYTPMRTTVGAAWDALPSLTLTADLDWIRWSAFSGGAPDLAVLVHLAIAPSLVHAAIAEPSFHDVWAPRVGAEWRRALGSHVELAVRGGYAFERSPVPDQVGLTSFADNDRHVIALGGGVALSNITSLMAKPLRFDVALQWQELVPRTTVKDPSFAPGAGFTSGGRLVNFAAMMEARF